MDEKQKELLEGWIEESAVDEITMESEIVADEDVLQRNSIDDLPYGMMCESKESRIIDVKENQDGSVEMKEILRDGKEDSVGRTVAGMICKSKQDFIEWKQERIQKREKGEIKWLKNKKKEKTTSK